MSTPSAGWYADASNPALVRWWDGAAWSEYTQPNPAASTAIDAEAAPVSSPPVSSSPVSPAPVSSAPYVPPPFAEVSPPPAEAAEVAAAPVASAPLDYPPPVLSAPELVSPSAAIGTGSRRDVARSMPISEPVRLVPPTADSAPIAGFPGFTDAPPTSSSEVAPVSGSFAVAPLATATPKPASASTPWTSSATFAQPTGSVDLASADYEPMTRSWGSARTSTPGRTVTGVATGGAWMLAISPLFTLGLAALGWWLTDGGASTITTYVAPALGATALAWIIIGAITDYRRLGALGHEFRPSVAWILLGPFFYLVARAIHVYRTARAGTAPTWLYVVSAIVVSLVVSATSLLIPRDAGLTELRAVEESIASDLQQQGLDYTVLCPSEAPASLGSSFVCTAYDEVGPVAIIRVTWTGLGGGFGYDLVTTAAIPG